MSINLGFTNMDTAPGTYTGSETGTVYVTDQGIIEPSHTEVFEEAVIIGDPAKKRFPWWLLLVAGGVAWWAQTRG